MSAVRIYHCADVHVGMKFNGRPYPATTREQLVNERFQVVERVVKQANELNAHFLVVAGDLFDTIHVGPKAIQQIAKSLNQFTGQAVLVLPGNHDYLESKPQSLWDVFRQHMDSDLVVLLDTYKPYSFWVGTREVIFYPAYCDSKHAVQHKLGWILQENKDAASLNIGIAHGNVEGFGMGDQYFNMTQDLLRDCKLDAWFLGHIHVPHPSASGAGHPLFYFSATPTPDGFDRSHPGYAWFVEIDANKQHTYTLLETGLMRFKEQHATLNTLDDFYTLKQALESSNNTNTLLKLKLIGSLPKHELETVQQELDTCLSPFLYTELDNQIRLHITMEDVRRLYPNESLPYKLLENLAQDEQGGLAMQLAYQLMEGMSK